MIRLRTLGTLDLRAPDGREIRSVLAQPKRTALLVYLAVATPQGFHRRDVLLGLFWPELDESRGRASLSTAVYNLRRALGPDVLVSRGDDEIGLARDRFWCDSAAFEQALDAGELDRALPMFEGELLPGFYLDDALEWERWLERERARLRERARSAAWTLAERADARDDAAAAADWWRRALLLTPDDERAHRKLLTLLDRRGDRAGALREHQHFAQRLRAEYDAEPSAETRTLVAELRSRAERAAAAVASPAPQRQPAPAAAPAAAAPPEQPAPEPLAPTVAPARVSAPAFEPAPAPASAPDQGRRRWLLAAVALLLVVGAGAAAKQFGLLAGEPAVSLAPSRVAIFPFAFHGSDDHAFRAAGTAKLLSARLNGALPISRTSGPLSADEARDVARRAGAGRFVLGEITEVGGRLRITATLHRGGAPAVPAMAEGDADRFVALVDQLAAKLRAGGIEAPLTRLARTALRSTRSEPARQAFLQVEAEYHAGRYAAAAEAFGRAAKIDTTFALALYRLSVATHWNGQDWLVRQAAARAEQQAARLPTEDRLLVQAWNAYLRGDALQAERMYRSALAQHPDETDAWFYLGETLFHWMPMLGRSAGESRPMWERVLRDDPNNVGALIHLARVAAGEKRQAEFETLLARLLAVESGSDQLLEMRAVRAFAWGTHEEQAAIVRELVGGGERALRAAVSSVGVHSRNLAGAERLARPLTESVWDPEGRAADYLLRAQMEMGQGRLRAAGTSVDSATVLSPDFGIQYRGVQAALPFVPAQPAELIRVRALIDGSYEAVDDSPKAERIGPWRPYLSGLLSVRLGDIPNALRSVDELGRSSGTRSDSAFSRQYARVLQSEVAWLQGDPRRALAALGEPQLEPDGTLAEILSYPKAQERWLRAELLRELGRHQEALRIYGSFPDPAGYDLMYLAPSHLRRAEILEEMGQQREAAWHYARFVDLWKDTDPILQPMLSSAARNGASRRGAPPRQLRP